MERIKYISIILIIAFTSSCSNKGKEPNSLPVVPIDNNNSGISESFIDSSIMIEATGDKSDAVNKKNKYTKDYFGTYFNVDDLSFLLDDTSIKSLNLSGGTFFDLSVLTAFKGLEELKITSNTYITDISPLSSLENLKKLELFNIDNLESIKPLSSLINLQYLRLSYSDNYFRELVPLQCLEVLDLTALGIMSEEHNITYIAQLQSLKELCLNTGVIINGEHLSKLVNLERLYFSGYEFKLSWIISLKNIKELIINCRSPINDVSPLLELPNLTKVNFCWTKIKDIRPLLQSKSLKKVTITIFEDDTFSDVYSLFEEKGIELQSFNSGR